MRLGLIIVMVMLFSPTFSLAQGLVPCNPTIVKDSSGRSVIADPCDFCDIGQLIYNVMNTLTVIFGILLTIMIIIGGTYLAASAGSAEAKTTVKRVLSTAIVGYIIMLTAWTVTDAFMKILLLNGSQIGIWNSPNC